MKANYLQLNGSATRHAFTLIELMIAIGLGMLIVVVAVSGVRMASQSVTTSNRLALENSMMRAGYFAAMQDADYWLAWDDPDSPTDQGLRDYEGAPPYGRGLPFSDFNQTIFPKRGTEGTDQERGWNPNYAWHANDSRTWFNGNLVEEGRNSGHVFGHYELFAHHKTSPNLIAQTCLPPLNKPNDTPAAKNKIVGVVFGGQATPKRTWYSNQIEGLKNSLGYYGVIDYMPANAIYGTPGDPGPDNAYGTGDDFDQRMSREWVDPSGSGATGAYRFANSDGGTSWARGIYRHTRDSTYPIIAKSKYTEADTSGWDTKQLIRDHCHSWATDRVGNATGQTSGNGIQDLTKKALLDRPLVEVRPESWPDMYVHSMRYISNSRFVAMFRIGWISPLTGEATSLSLTTVSTSLRGARQQRRPTKNGGGWAKPGEANLDTGY